MGTFVRLLAALVLVALAIGIGSAVYNEGVSAGLAQAAQPDGGEAAGEDAVGYAEGPFRLAFAVVALVFGILASALLLVIVLGLARIAFGRHGPGHGRWGDRQNRIEEWHRELHRREAEGDQRPLGA